MAKIKRKKLPIEVRDQLCKGWYVICQTKETVVIANNLKRRIFCCGKNSFVFQWEVDLEAIKKQEELLFA